PGAITDSAVGIQPALSNRGIPRLAGALRAGSVQSVTQHQPVSSDKKIANADVQSFPELALDLQAGLVGIRQLIVVPVHPACPGRACRRTGPGDERARIEAGCDYALGSGRGGTQTESSPEVDSLAHQRRR